jgi:hypothetical protein
VARELRVAIDVAVRRLGERPMLGRVQLVLVYDPTTVPARVLRMLHIARDLPAALAGIEL